MSRNSTNTKTFSIGFKPEELNELKFAKYVAKYFNNDHHEYLVESDDFFSLLKKLIWHHDEPLIFPASIPLYILSKHSKNNATVMLAGEGADELFAGYTNNVKAYWLSRFASIVPSPAVKTLLMFPFNERHKSVLTKTRMTEKELICSFFQLYKTEDILRIYESQNLKDLDDRLWDEVGLENRGGSFIDKLIYFQMKTYLVALLMKQDKMSMAASIETRVPFLDHHLVEFACQIPHKYKIRMNHGKYILKRSCEGLLPKRIIYRKKMGFPVPIAQWFKEKNNPFIEVLLDSSTKRRSFLNFNFIEKAVEESYRNNEHATKGLWTLLNLELWRREFLDRN